MSTRWRISILIALAVVAYLPSLRLPFIVDDYHQIGLARDYAAQSWTPLLHNPALRSRATYMFLSAALDRAFGFDPVAFHAAGIALHVICVLLVYGSAVWREIGERTAFFGAAFFAIQEGHQEAIMWPAAAGDLLVFLFGMAAWLCWVKWLERGGFIWYGTAIVSFLLAVASKESVWAFAVFFLLPVLLDRRYSLRALRGAGPFVLIATGYVIWSLATRVAGPATPDIRFSLSAPWLLTLFNSFWRLVLPWGLVAAAVLTWAKRPGDRQLRSAAVIWMLVGLLPFSFLTYMHQIPSRLTYIATAGLAWLVGAAAQRLLEERQTAVFAMIAFAVVAVNLEITWVKKMAQFRERAEASERLRQAGAQASGPVAVHCIGLPDFVAVEVLKSVGATGTFDRSAGAAADEACLSLDYRNRAGAMISVSGRIRPAHHGTFY